MVFSFIQYPSLAPIREGHTSPASYPLLYCHPKFLCSVVLILYMVVSNLFCHLISYNCKKAPEEKTREPFAWGWRMKAAAPRHQNTSLLSRPSSCEPIRAQPYQPRQPVLLTNAVLGHPDGRPSRFRERSCEYTGERDQKRSGQPGDGTNMSTERCSKRKCDPDDDARPAG